jgi:ubiquinone/menaquinone biosynthesis C-methylase UbiE
MESSATNPAQYDSPELNWIVRGAEDRPSRKFFRDSLDEMVPEGSLKGKTVLDVGCGVGQLFNWLKEKGATGVYGIDPSVRNITYASEKYPWAILEVATLQKFSKNKDKKFGALFALMVFEHIQDLHQAFLEVKKLLDVGSNFYLAVYEKNYSLLIDKDRRTRVEKVEVVKDFGAGEIEIKTTSQEKEGTNILFDIVRPVENVIRAAEGAGLTLVNHIVLVDAKIDPPIPANHLLCFKNS